MLKKGQKKKLPAARIQTRVSKMNCKYVTKKNPTSLEIINMNMYVHFALSKLYASETPSQFGAKIRYD